MTARSGMEWGMTLGVPALAIAHPRRFFTVASSCIVLLGTKRWWRYILLRALRRTLSLSSFSSPQQQVAKEFQELIDRNDGDGCGILLVDSPTGRLELASGTLSSFSSIKACLSTRFEIASVTKMMVSHVILSLASKGSVALDAAISELLPVQGLENITVRQLLTHTSGLPDFWNDGEGRTVQDLAAKLDWPSPWIRPLSFLWCYITLTVFGRAIQLNTFMFQSIAAPLLVRKGEGQIWDPRRVLQITLENYGSLPCGAYHYSDTNYVILGILLEELHKQPLHEVLRQAIFEPLGMHDTYLRYDYTTQTDYGAKDHQLSTRYRSKGKWPLGKFAWTFPDYSLGLLPFLTVPARYISADWASGGVVSTARDLCVFMRGLVRDQEHWNLIVSSMSPEIPYGFGIKLVNVAENQGAIFGHTGNGGACLYYWPKHDVVFAGTTNNNISNMGSFVKQLILSDRVNSCLADDNLLS